jgi:hypothetical protein
VTRQVRQLTRAGPSERGNKAPRAGFEPAAYCLGGSLDSSGASSRRTRGWWALRLIVGVYSPMLITAIPPVAHVGGIFGVSSNCERRSDPAFSSRASPFSRVIRLVEPFAEAAPVLATARHRDAARCAAHTTARRRCAYSARESQGDAPRAVVVLRTAQRERRRRLPLRGARLGLAPHTRLSAPATYSRSGRSALLCARSTPAARRLRGQPCGHRRLGAVSPCRRPASRRRCAWPRPARGWPGPLRARI